MTQRIRWIWILALIATAGCGKKDRQVVAPQTHDVSAVSVWVNDTGITTMDIQAEVQRLFKPMASVIREEQIPAIRVRLIEQAVNRLVVRQLIQDEMARSGILISQAEIEAAKAELEKELGQGESLAMILASANQTIENLEMDLRLDLFKNKVLKEKHAAAVEAVTDAVVETYYHDHPQEFTEKAGRLVSHIFLRIPADAGEATRMDLRAKAEGLRTQLIEGADFETLAAEQSECASREQGGHLGVIPRGQEVKAFEDAVYGQEIGVIGDVVRSPQGFHIIKVTGERDERLLPFDEIAARLAVVLKTRARQLVTDRYIADLREKASIKLDGPIAQIVEAAKAKQATADASTDAPADSTPLLTTDGPTPVPGVTPAIP